MTFPKEGDAFGSMKQLIKQGVEEDALLQGERDEAVPKIVDEIGKVLGATKNTVEDGDVTCLEKITEVQRLPL